jgi:hypothetical protein
MAEYQVKEDAKIMGVRIEITSPDGSKISPSYEAHSIEKVNEIIAATQELITDGSTLEVFIY